MEFTRHTIANGITLTAGQTDRFKTSVLSVHFLSPLRRETAALSALLPHVLRRGTELHPDLQSLAAALDERYGMRLEPYVRKKGEVHGVGFAADFVEGRYLKDAARQLIETLALTAQVLLDPTLENDIFRADYVAGEKTNLADQLAAQINDKRYFAKKRLTALMCDDEPFGLDRLGDTETLSAITPASLWKHFEELLTSAPIELFYLGSESPELVVSLWQNIFKGVLRQNLITPVTGVRRAAGGEVRRFEDTLDVTQGKLALGLRTGVTYGDEDYHALLVALSIFGIGPGSKLFMNVREAQSLCYYATAQPELHKGVCLVDSGVEFAEMERAETAILDQWEAVRAGNFTDEELENARVLLTGLRRAALDSPHALEEYYLGQAVSGQNLSPERDAEKIAAVTREQVLAAAQKPTLDAIYAMKGRV